MTIVIRLNSVAVAALTVFAVLANCDDSYYKYMNMIGTNRIGHTYHTNLMETLAKLNVQEGEQAESILRKLELARDDISDPGHLRALLLSLGDGQDHCPEDVIHVAKYMLQLLRAREPDPLVMKFRDYIHKYGLEKFEKCAIRADQKLMKYKETDEAALDEYFTEAMDLEVKERNESEMYELLRKFDLTKHPVNAERLLKLAQRSKHSRDETDEQLLNKAIDSRCKPFKKPLSTNHDLLNLSKVLGSTHKFSSKFMKMNEYRRLCLQTKRPKSLSAVRQNFRYSLPKERRKEKKACFWDKMRCRQVEVA